MDLKLREKSITRTSIIGILVNLCLVAFKAVAGLMAGSIAIVLDAINNLTDAMSSIITIVGIKLAKRQPDDKHPFGYGRIEYFSAIIISLIVFVAGITSGIESVKKIFVPEIPDYSVVTVVIIVASVVTKLLLGRFVMEQGKKYNSDALVASGADASMDAILSASTLVAAVITLIFHISVDGYIGVLIALFIIKAGLEMLLEAVSDVMGNRADSEITKDIKATVRSVDGVIGAYDLVLHNYGPNSAIGSIHVEVEDKMSAAQFHLLTVRIQELIAEKFHVFLTVGIYAVDLQDARKREMRENIIKRSCEFEGAVNAHGVFIDDEKKKITYDMCLDFSIQDKAAMAKKVQDAIREMYPEYVVTVKFDTNYSD